MDSSYVGILVSFGIAGLVVAILMGGGALLRARGRDSSVKREPFECGNPSSGPAWGRFSVKFYLTAILFIVFDIEVVFLIPWAVVFRPLGLFGFATMALFVGVLLLGLVYVWRKGALEWT
jgi:NADH-quinone oxidoreductase subunit A